MSSSDNSLLPQSLVDLAAEVIKKNLAASKMIALAESCTGGLVAAAITEVAGSSKVLDRGFVTYSNEAKIESLDVSAELIETFGAVSVAVAWAMARGALANSNADVAVAITGIAGPDGGSEDKPVGTVVFACAHRGEDENEIVAEEKHFGAQLSRAEIRQLAAQSALELLLL